MLAAPMAKETGPRTRSEESRSTAHDRHDFRSAIPRSILKDSYAENYAENS